MTLTPSRGRCHTCGHDHDEEGARLRDLMSICDKAKVGPLFDDPEYQRVFDGLCASNEMQPRQVLRAMLRLYQADQAGPREALHSKLGPLAAPVQPAPVAVAPAVNKALRRAYGLGQTYWQQADSESYLQNKKADATEQKFVALLDETMALLAAPTRTPDAGAAAAQAQVCCTNCAFKNTDSEDWPCKPCRSFSNWKAAPALPNQDSGALAGESGV